MVPMSDIFKSEPIHVQRKMGINEENTYMCKQRLCMLRSESSYDDDVKICSHIEGSELPAVEPIQMLKFDRSLLNAISLPSKELRECQLLAQLANERKVPVVVEWIVKGDKFTFVSVISDSENDLPFGRVIVKCYPEKNLFLCSHPNINPYCPHIILSKIFLGSYKKWCRESETL